MDGKEMYMDNLFYVLKTLFEGNEINYISTPINTGERFIKWYDQRGRYLDENSEEYKVDFLNSVVEPNTKNAKQIVKIIKEKIHGAIIDPTNLENHTLNWTQDEFYSFWSRVIKDMVTNVIFLDGWEYSVGCSFELLSAIENKKVIYSQDLIVLDTHVIVRKLQNSVNLYTQLNLKSADKLIKILDQINKF